MAELCVGKAASTSPLDPLGRTIVGRAIGRDGQPARLMGGKVGAQFSEQVVREFWGMFLAVEIPPDGDPVRVTRDASSLLPAYYAATGSELIVASDVSLLTAERSVKSIDWTAVATHLHCDSLRTRRTCIAGVSELLAGEVLVAGHGQFSVKPVWSPWAFTHRDAQINDYRSAVDQLRDCVLSTVAALANGYEHAVIGISGGLDSSVVAAALLNSGVKISALTLATTAPGGDERHYARILSSGLGFGLTEAVEEVDCVDIAHSEAAGLPRPVARSFAQWGNRRHAELATDVAADVFFNGAGGDNVFCALNSVSMLADRWMTEGLRIGLLHTARDLAVMGDTTWWDALKRGLARARRKPLHYRWPLTGKFLSEYSRTHVAFEHPWLAARPDGTLPGKSAHVAWMMGIQNHLEGFSHGRIHPIVSPLVAQPVQELCLRIPTWFWCAGGRNRAVARDAFADLLPQAIVNRTSKGTPSTFVLALMRANSASIKEMLNYGILAEHGFVDTGAVNACLDCPDDPVPATYARMMALVDVEAWLQSWRG
ncbi:asparagine synthetase B family protein [Novosphingobium sp. KA1]|uniref:asparagine synthase-related protein n=1 Tax=Novosphingobium sp. (strain KA1) TaxID=164608 RepID=UPI001A90A381|nr:asparagine synthetase B family protein [Novosphingobium sp. KA1]